nr:hypothetical protein [Tanacetum cinerariifolium]
MNYLERNDMHFPIVTINTKFLNSLQPEWLKYVTQVRLAKRLTVDTFDDLFDCLQQFEKLVNTSRAKKLEKSHDPLALVAHTASSSRNTSSYYVTHPTFVVDYDDEYQQDDIQTSSEDPLTSAMLLIARAITQNFSNPTNNRLCTSSNTRNQAVIQGDQWKRTLFKELSKAKSSGLKILHGTNVAGQTRIQPTNHSSDVRPSYDSDFVNKISKIEKLKHENVSLDFQVKSLIKERDNVKAEYQKLFDSIKKTRSQTQKKIDELIAQGNHVVSKPVTLQTSPDKQKVNDVSSVRRSMNRDSHGKNIVLANSKNSAKKVAVYVRKNKQTDNTSSNVISNKENVIDVDIANASKAKNLLCVSADELHQEDSANFDGNSQFVTYNPSSYEAIKSSSTTLEPSNMQNFHQV